MTTPHDKALSAAINEIRLWQVSMTAGEFVVFRRLEDGTITDEARHSSLEENHSDFTARSMSAAISAYLSSIGGIVCTREPVGAWYEDGTGCFHMSLNVELEEKKARENGHQIHYFHEPIEAGNGGDGWNHDMDAAPKDKTPVIIAVPQKDNDAYIVGEAYFDPEHYGDGDWWWAGNSYGDYHGGPISEINYHGPSAWRPLPTPPSIPPTGREKA